MVNANNAAYEVTYKLRPNARKVYTAIRFGSAAGTIEGCVVLSVRELTEAERIARIGW